MLTPVEDDIWQVVWPEWSLEMTILSLSTERGLMVWCGWTQPRTISGKAWGIVLQQYQLYTVQPPSLSKTGIGCSNKRKISLSDWQLFNCYHLISNRSISWSCQKQSIVALSSTKAEFIALTHASKEALWLQHFITELFQPLESPIKLHSDNQSATCQDKALQHQIIFH